MDEQTLRTHLSGAIEARVQSLRWNDGTVTAILDGGALSPAERAQLEHDCQTAIEAIEGVENVRLAVVAERVKRRIIAIGSGKGGVGKSTLTANLAVAMARMGCKVGVVDADVYGPSQPTLLATKGQRPEADDKQLIPVNSTWGVPMLSMGHLIEGGKALAWRGPMAASALSQLIDAQWGEVDTLLVDMPPGTGDVQLTMLQKHKPDGAIIVSTPQNLALIDAQRAAQLFEAGQVPIIGLVENMTGYACPHCGETSDPFGAGGVAAIAQATGLALLGSIPLSMDLRQASDAGTPPAADEQTQGALFEPIARQLVKWLDQGQA